MAHPYRAAGRTGAKSKFKAMLGSDAGAKHTNDDSVASARAKVTNGVDDVKIMGKAPPKRLDRARGGKVKDVTVNVVIPPNQGPPPLPPMMAKPPMPMPPPGAMGPPPGGPPMPTPGAGLPMQKAKGGAVSKKAGGGRATIPPRSNRTQKAIKGFQDRIDSLDSPIKDIAPVDPAWVPGKNKGGKVSKKAFGGGLPMQAAPQAGAALGARPMLPPQAMGQRPFKDGGAIKKAKLTGGADSGVGRLQHSKAQGKHNRGK